MSNYYIVKEKEGMIWVDWVRPTLSMNDGPVPEELYNDYENRYNNRPHYPYDKKLFDWKDGMRVLQGTDFEIKAEEIRKVRCHCPCHKTPGMVHIAACCINGYNEYRTPATAIPLPSKEQEEKTERLFTLQEMIDAYETGELLGEHAERDGMTSQDVRQKRGEYFQNKFNIIV